MGSLSRLLVATSSSSTLSGTYSCIGSQVCYYRDKQSINKFQIAKVTKDGASISEPFAIETTWNYRVRSSDLYFAFLNALLMQTEHETSLQWLGSFQLALRVDSLVLIFVQSLFLLDCFSTCTIYEYAVCIAQHFVDPSANAAGTW